ncbi:MAG TPA: hypothetical protein VEK73_00395, partial [Xanthobacteraceae bacterium]|nr:hypothetical protein [Xanthobacteraceae bacterium]
GMTSDESDAARAGQPPGGRRREPPVIEGTATEVASEPMTPPAPEPAVEPEPASTAAPDAHAAPRGEDRPPPAGRSPRDAARPMIAGGAAGLAVALLTLAAWWLFAAHKLHDDTAALAGKVAALDAQMQQRPQMQKEPAAGDAEALDDLRARVDAIDASLHRLDDRLARAESALATARSAPIDPALLDRLGAAESAQWALAATVADLRQRIEQASTAKTAGPQGDAAARGEIEALAARVAALEHAERAPDQPPTAADRAVRLAVVATALQAAVARGTPFAAELAAAKALGADAAVLVPLEAAAAGVPRAEALAQDLDKLAPAMLAAVAPPAHDDGILGRLQANAERLVRVRPVGEAAGDDPAAGLARAVAKAQRADIAGALAEVERLPAAVQAPAADWIKAAKARTAALEAARQLVATSLAALSSP